MARKRTRDENEEESASKRFKMLRCDYPCAYGADEKDDSHLINTRIRFPHILSEHLSEVRKVELFRVDSLDVKSVIDLLAKSAVEDLYIDDYVYGSKLDSTQFAALCTALGRMKHLRAAFLPIGRPSATENVAMCEAIVASTIEELGIRVGAHRYMAGSADLDVLGLLADAVAKAGNRCRLRRVSLKFSCMKRFDVASLLKLAACMPSDRRVVFDMAGCRFGVFYFSDAPRELLELTVKSRGRIVFEGIDGHVRVADERLIEEATRAAHNYDTRNTTLAARCARRLQDFCEQTAMQTIAVRHALRRS